MNELEKLDIQNLLPDSIADDEEVQNLAEIITEKLLQVNQQTETIKIWENIPERNDDILLNLAWQFHTDLYDSSLPKETRAQLVENSLLWHRFRGTLYSVTMALRSVFKTGTIKEWFEYGGKPYHFMIGDLTESVSDESSVNKLIDLITKSKNLRSWCEDIEFERKASGNITIGGAVLDETDLVISSDLKEEFRFRTSIVLRAAVLDSTNETIYARA